MTKFKSLVMSAGVAVVLAGAASTGASANVLVDVYIYNGNTYGSYADNATIKVGISSEPQIRMSGPLI